MKCIIECVIEIVGAILMIISIPLLISMFINIFKDLKQYSDNRYVVTCKRNERSYYTEMKYFKTRRDARHFIKLERHADKVLHNPRGIYFKYKIIKIK